MYLTGIILKTPVESLDVTGKTNAEVVRILREAKNHAEVEPDKVTETVTLIGASIKRCAEIDAEYSREELGEDIVAFSKNGKRHLGRSNIGKEAA